MPRFRPAPAYRLPLYQVLQTAPTAVRAHADHPGWETAVAPRSGYPRGEHRLRQAPAAFGLRRQRPSLAAGERAVAIGMPRQTRDVQEAVVDRECEQEVVTP